jgi:hypothetical protein
VSVILECAIETESGMHIKLAGRKLSFEEALKVKEFLSVKRKHPSIMKSTLFWEITPCSPLKASLRLIILP